MRATACTVGQEDQKGVHATGDIAGPGNLHLGEEEVRTSSAGAGGQGAVCSSVRDGAVGEGVDHSPVISRRRKAKEGQQE